MNKLLVPFDGSGPALRALDLACEIGREVHLVHVQREADAPVLLLHITPDELRRQQLQHAETVVADVRRRLEASGRPHQVHLCIGEPAEEIARVVREQRVDGVVMGSRGKNAFANMTFGSTATKVVHLVEVPVTLVK